MSRDKPYKEGFFIFFSSDPFRYHRPSLNREKVPGARRSSISLISHGKKGRILVHTAQVLEIDRAVNKNDAVLPV